jgi:hypothetical protein
MLGSIPTSAPHLHSAPPASVATVGVPAVPTATPRQQVVGVGATSAAQEEQLFRLSRLILAEEQIRSTSKGIAAAHDRVSSGADIISSCITESILNKAYRIQQQSSNRVDPDKIVYSSRSGRRKGSQSVCTCVECCINCEDNIISNALG